MAAQSPMAGPGVHALPRDVDLHPFTSPSQRLLRSKADPRSQPRPVRRRPTARCRAGLDADQRPDVGTRTRL